MKIKILLFLLLLIFLVVCLHAVKPPLAKEIPETTYVFDHILIDEYSWLKDKTRSKEEIIQYLHAENNFSQQIMKETEGLQQSLYNEYLDRLIYEDASVPVKIDSFFYYTRRENGSNYLIHCRKKHNLSNKEEIYFDENEFSAGESFFSVNQLKISPNHGLLAITVDYAGAERYKLMIMDIADHKFYKEQILGVEEFAWELDSNSFFYTGQDSTGRSCRIMHHRLGDNPRDDRLIYEEQDPAFYTWITKSHSGKYFYIGSEDNITSEYRYLPINHDNFDFQLIAPRIRGQLYKPFDQRDNFIIVTNWNEAGNYEIIETPIQSPSRNNWKTVINHRDSVEVDIDVYDSFILLFEKQNNRKKIVILDDNFGVKSRLEFDEDIYNLNSIYAENYYSDFIRFSYESYKTPYSVYTYNTLTSEKNRLKQEPLPADFDPDKFICKQLQIPARDGEIIPLTIIMNKEQINQNSPYPLLLEAYGAYGDASTPWFSRTLPSLLNRGFIYAVAHVRGGDEKGNYWYEQGKILNKKNTFLDFIDCAEFLINKGYTSPEMLAAKGGSAGGLLMGAITNLRPDLFNVVIANVPFVDLVNSMLDPSLSAVITEYEEWGDPNIEREFEYMLSYDPYYQISEQIYPNILAITGFYDTRVDYWGPAKWIAKLRKYNRGDNLVLLRTEMNSGHFGYSGRFDYYREVAFEQSFIISRITGINE